jgi:hypothetical protein
VIHNRSVNNTDPAKRINVTHELKVLSEERDRSLAATEGITSLTTELKRVNEILWQIEDDIRDCERCKDFGPAFIDLARSVYRSNDRRTTLKRALNELTGSDLVEEKSYQTY